MPGRRIDSPRAPERCEKSGAMKLLLIITAALVFVFAPTASAEPQPAMHEALEHLRAAKARLAHAEHDKGGHRAKAIEFIDAAEREIHAGIGFDNMHGPRHKK